MPPIHTAMRRALGLIPGGYGEFWCHGRRYTAIYGVPPQSAGLWRPNREAEAGQSLRSVSCPGPRSRGASQAHPILSSAPFSPARRGLYSVLALPGNALLRPSSSRLCPQLRRRCRLPQPLTPPPLLLRRVQSPSRETSRQINSGSTLQLRRNTHDNAPRSLVSFSP